uniref:ATP synthase subunit e, mitochondrial n=1 Tax=Strongyloides stercoralis TaxID=6248 RepID=A0A0K0EHD6_STRER
MNLGSTYGKIGAFEIKRLFVSIVGIVVGSKIVNHYYEPTKEYERRLEEGKRELLVKYTKIHEDRLKRLGISEVSK